MFIQQDNQIKTISKFNSISNVLSQFDVLDRAVIDTSSLIYLNNINLLHTASNTLHLMTVPEVVKEFGSLSGYKNIELIDLKEVERDNKDSDLYLIGTAKSLQLPIISEDKKILMQAKGLGLAFFNTLMVMNFLIYKKVINQADYQTALDQLQNEAYYDKRIFEYGKKVFERIV